MNAFTFQEFVRLSDINMATAKQPPTRTTSYPFPENLPPRDPPPREVKVRDCYTFRFFKSYKATHLRGHAIKARKASMILDMIIAITTVPSGILFGFWGNVIGIIVATIIAILEIWLVLWCVAIIGDAGKYTLWRPCRS